MAERNNSVNWKVIVGFIAVVLTNAGVSYLGQLRVANKTVIQDNVKIEFLQAQAKINADNIIKLDEHIVGKENFSAAIALLKEQNEITRQMIMAHERRNDLEFIKLQDQYELLEQQLSKEITKYRSSSIVPSNQIPGQIPNR